MPLRLCEILTEAEKKLVDAGIDEWKNDAWLLFEYVFGLNRTKYLLCMRDYPDSMEKGRILYERYQNLIERRCGHIPLQHLTGQQEFMGLNFEVNEHVLIPRQDTEILVEEALKVCEQFSGGEKILDMCTGSGCIAVSVKRFSKKEVDVTAVDISEEALKVAERNAATNQCDIDFVQSDLFEQLQGKAYDMILSNPPYIKSGEIMSLMEEVRDYEPVLALDGAENGLKFYEAITKEAVKFLKPGGYLIYEIGYDQSEDLHRILRENGFSHIVTKKDLAGLDRVVMSRKTD